MSYNVINLCIISTVLILSTVTTIFLINTLYKNC